MITALCQRLLQRGGGWTLLLAQRGHGQETPVQYQVHMSNSSDSQAGEQTLAGNVEFVFKSRVD